MSQARFDLPTSVDTPAPPESGSLPGAGAQGTPYELCLFVNGATTGSARAVEDVRAVCQAYLPGRFHLEVIDVNQALELVASYRVLASPMLVKERPFPVRVVVGDLSDRDRVLAALDLRAALPGSLQ